MITCEEYRDRNKKNAAYQEIATELGISGKYRVDTLTFAVLEILNVLFEEEHEGTNNMLYNWLNWL